MNMEGRYLSDFETLIHIFKSVFGTGILSMPAAFYASGLFLGLAGTIVVSFICTHCAYILVVCAHELYERTERTEMTFAEVAEESCLLGPEWGKKFAKPARLIVEVGIFIAYFTTCSCYSVIIASNFEYIIFSYLGHQIEIRIILAAMIGPFILLEYIPNLKSLVPVMLTANILMLIGIGITFYYLVIDLPPLSERVAFQHITKWPTFISITIFAVEAIGVVMPLENHMKIPEHIIGWFGVLVQGFTLVTVIYAIVGFFGYFKYGSDVKGSITLNLPGEEHAAKAVNIIISMAVFCTFGIQFYVCIEIAWNGIKHRYEKHKLLAEYVLRTVMVILCLGLSIAVPKIIPFVSLIGAFCFSIIGLLVPVGIEIVTFWERGFGFCYWKVFKNIVVVIAALIALIFGSLYAIEDIIELYVLVYEEDPKNI